jgi:hypothetical protein
VQSTVQSLRSDVDTAVKMSDVYFWLVTACGIVDPAFWKNIGNHLQYYTASQPRVPQSTQYEVVNIWKDRSRELSERDSLYDIYFAVLLTLIFPN